MEKSGKSILVGIVSKGTQPTQCGGRGTMTHYVRIKKFVNWIRHHTTNVGGRRRRRKKKKKQQQQQQRERIKIFKETRNIDADRVVGRSIGIGGNPG